MRCGIETNIPGLSFQRNPLHIDDYGILLGTGSATLIVDDFKGTRFLWIKTELSGIVADEAGILPGASGSGYSQIKGT